METLAPRKLATARPRLEVPLALVFCAGVTALLVILGYIAQYNAQAARDARARLEALQRSTTAAERARKALYRPVPHSRTVNVFGAPFNVRVVCTISGSVRAKDGTRKPLDLAAKAQPGDVYVKTCRGYARSGGGQASGALSG